MATKSITGRVVSTQLEQSLSKTIVSDYVRSVDSNYMSLLQGRGDNIMLPSLDYFMGTIAPESFSRFVDLYNRYMGLEDGVDVIPDEVKAVQGALLDGLCFGYDVADDTFALYTMNFDLLNNELGVSRDMASMCIKSNIVGHYKAYRIDVEYDLGPDAFSFKAVNHRKILDNESVILLPYVACVRLMKMLEGFLNSGSVLRVKQDIGGSEKIRYITKNMDVLSRYCDTPEAVRGLEPSYFPLRAFFYAPVIGAPSTTAMVTNVSLFNLCEVRKIRLEKVSSLGIVRPTDPVRMLIEDRSFANRVYAMAVGNSFAFSDLIPRLPRGAEFFGDVNSVSYKTLSSYLHGLSTAERKSALEVVPEVSEDISKLSWILSGGIVKVIDPSRYNELAEILRKHVCRFIIRKKDCSLSSILGTNNRAILAGVYGDDYFSKYEGFGVRFNEAFREVELGKSIKSALEGVGFTVSVEVCNQIDGLYEKAGRVISNDFRSESAKLLGYKTKAQRSPDTGTVLLRTLNAVITEKGVEEYYKNLDLGKIVNAIIIK